MAEWHERPLFVPFGSGHLAAVLTLPASGSRGLVLLLQGWGATRSHRNRVWTRTARALADRGIASIRFDYPRVGDSTGEARPDWEAPPIDEALAIAKIGRSMTRVRDVAVIGNCMGARTALAIATQLEACRAVACILINRPEALVEHRHQGQARRTLGKAVARGQRIKRMLRPWLRWTRRRSFHLIAPVREVLASKPTLFVYLGQTEAASRFEREALKAVRNGHGGTVKVHHIPCGPVEGFRIPLELQSVVITSLVDWLDLMLPRTSSAMPDSVTKEG